MKIGHEGDEKEVEPVVHWVVDLTEEIDTLQACDSGLRRVRALLEDCGQLFKASG